MEKMITSNIKSLYVETNICLHLLLISKSCPKNTQILRSDNSLYFDIVLGLIFCLNLQRKIVIPLCKKTDR